LITDIEETAKQQNEDIDAEEEELLQLMESGLSQIGYSASGTNQVFLSLTLQVSFSD